MVWLANAFIGGASPCQCAGVVVLVFAFVIALGLARNQLLVAGKARGGLSSRNNLA